MEIKQGVKPKEGSIQTVYLQAVLMSQGEIICLGKTIGWFKELKKYLYLPKPPNPPEE